MPYYIGDNVRVGVAVNAESSGMTYGGTPGTYDVFKLAAGGGISIEPRVAKERVDEVDVDARDVIFGGLGYTITMELIGSYSYREKLFQLISGGAISTTGASAPYAHAVALADKLLFGSLKLEYTDQAEQANEVVNEVYSNFCVTALSLKESPEGYLQMTVSGVASALTRTTNVAALTAVNNSEPISWSHLTVSLNGATTYKVGDISVDITADIVADEFDHAATTPALLPGIFRSGHREVGWSVDVRMDSSAYTLTADTGTTWTGANSFTWDNGAATTANRKLVLTFGNSYIETSSHGIKGWGRQTRTVPLKALDGSTRCIAIVCHNARTTIPA